MVSDKGIPSMGTEDFSNYQRVIPGAMYSLGNGRPGLPPADNHTSNFNFNDKNLASGAVVWIRIVEDRFNLKLL